MKCYAYDNADKRRRDRRQALTEAYNRKNGIAAVSEQPSRPVLSMKKRKPVDRVQAAVSPISFEYRAQIAKAADELYAIAMKGKQPVEGSYCLPEVAMFAAGHRGKPKNPYHVQK